MVGLYSPWSQIEVLCGAKAQFVTTDSLVRSTKKNLPSVVPDEADDQRKQKRYHTTKKILGLALFLFTACISIAAALALSMLVACVYLYPFYKKDVHHMHRQASTEIPQKMPSVYLFKGDEKNKGVSIESVNALEKSISRLSSSLKVVLCNNDKMAPSNWDNKGLVVFPGGKCSDWNELLSDEKQMQIHEWFKNGGRILGICAGAYFCSQRSSYQLMSRVRKIALFSGECQGPAFSSDLKVVKVRWEKSSQEGYVTVIQGGLFMPDKETSDDFEILARYVEEPHQGRIAVISCKKEKGLAILSAPHWEFNHDDLEGLEMLFPHLNIPTQQQKLKESHDFRQKCWSEMVNKLLN